MAPDLHVTRAAVVSSNIRPSPLGKRLLGDAEVRRDFAGFSERLPIGGCRIHQAPPIKAIHATIMLIRTAIILPRTTPSVNMPCQAIKMMLEYVLWQTTAARGIRR